MYLVKFILEIRFVLTSTQARRYVPKSDVGVFRLVQHQFKTRSVPYLLGEVFGVVEVIVDVRLQSVRSLNGVVETKRQRSVIVGTTDTVQN